MTDSFYFATVTFLTIGYGDIHPQSELAKIFLIVYMATSNIVQLTVLASLVQSAINFRKKGAEVPNGMNVRWLHCCSTANERIKVTTELCMIACCT